MTDFLQRAGQLLRKQPVGQITGPCGQSSSPVVFFSTHVSALAGEESLLRLLERGNSAENRSESALESVPSLCVG
jgi:hypothetical protein